MYIYINSSLSSQTEEFGSNETGLSVDDNIYIYIYISWIAETKSMTLGDCHFLDYNIGLMFKFGRN